MVCERKYMNTKRLAAVMTVGLLGALLGAGPATDVAVIVKPAFGKPAPEISVTDLMGKPVTLAGLKDKPVVLEFGSLTEPVVRMHAKDVETLAGKLGAKVTFLMVYEKEAHPAGTEGALDLNDAAGYSVPEATSQDGRIKLALELQDKLAIKNEHVLVDIWTNATAKQYGGLSNMTFLIDGNGNLAAAYPWMDAKKLQGAINDLLAGKPVADANMGPTRTQQQPITIPDGLGNQGPGAGVISAAIALDGMNLTDQQRAAVLKPLANYVAALRNLQAKAQAAGAAATGVAAAGGPAAPDKQAETQKVAEAALELKSTLRQQLKPADFQTMVDALNNGVGKQFFATAN
jgi:thiol-disulfide isomerase/thioredoxin